MWRKGRVRLEEQSCPSIQNMQNVIKKTCEFPTSLFVMFYYYHLASCSIIQFSLSLQNFCAWPPFYSLLHESLQFGFKLSFNLLTFVLISRNKPVSLLFLILFAWHASTTSLVKVQWPLPDPCFLLSSRYFYLTFLLRLQSSHVFFISLS